MEADAHVSDFQKKTSAKNRNVTNRMGSFKTCHLVQKKEEKCIQMGCKKCGLQDKLWYKCSVSVHEGLMLI